MRLQFISFFIICSTLSVISQSPSRFANFLLLNKWNTSDLPLSYRVPFGYWKDLAPEPYYNASIYNATPCGRMINATEMDNYRFQTEQMLTTLGLNLYDAAVREIALTLVGHADVAQKYETDTLIGDKTFQFGNIRASAACGGIMYYNKCTDSQQTGACGFCYGQNGVTLDAKHAYFFRMLSDVYAFEGTVDQRCPEKNLEWTWNDWRPVTGENAWGNFIGPFQVAYLQNKNVASITDSSNAMILGVIMFQAFQIMQLPNGAIAYAPWNTYDFLNPALGGTASTENSASSLASLRIFLYVLQNNPTTQYKSLIPSVQNVISGIESYLKSAYNPSLGYFYQGGTLINGNWQWNTDPASMFAVDCQTWTMSVLGAPTIDQWFGQNTALNIWETTMKLGGYVYSSSSDTVQGVGYSLNAGFNVFSGEWSFGAINMLRIFATQYTDSATQQKLNYQATLIRQNIESRLTFTDDVLQSSVVWYANKRYTIPWGWYANPVPSLASVSWAVMVDSNFNPFILGGSYNGSIA